MLEDFNFNGSGKLIFGIGKFPEIQSLADLGTSALICGNSFLKSKQYKQIENEIKFQFTISGEPDPDTIDRITEQIKNKVEIIIAVGGGSALDAGKAIAAMCLDTGSIEDFLEGIGTKAPSGKTLPLIAVPTTAGTGSEATKNAVICRRGENGYKKSLRHDNYIPQLVIIDPELYIQCPANIMSSCGMDAFCQLLESYISTNSNFYTDTLAWKGLTIFIETFTELCLSENRDLEKMGMIAFGAYLSGITLANAGLGTVHGIAGPMGGLFNIPHGIACGTLLPEVMKKTINKLYITNSSNALKKLEKLGLFISAKNQDHPGDNPAYAVSDLLDKWLIDLEIPRLAKFGIAHKDFEKIAALSGNKNNPVQFSKKEIVEIIRSRY